MKRQSNSVITVFFLVTLLLISSSLPFIDASNENKISDKGNSKINDKKDNNTAESYSNANLTNQGKKDKDGDGIVNGKDNCFFASTHDRSRSRAQNRDPAGGAPDWGRDPF